MSNPNKVTFFTPSPELQETLPPVPASKFGLNGLRNILVHDLVSTGKILEL